MTIPNSLLTPQNCVSPVRIKEFLRNSRALSDDTVREHANGHGTKYFEEHIAPEWANREKVVDYCANYAQKLRKGISLDDDKMPDFDLRVDPYAVQNYKQKMREKFDTCDSIDNWVANERRVESIIRETTLEAVTPRD